MATCFHRPPAALRHVRGQLRVVLVLIGSILSLGQKRFSRRLELDARADGWWAHGLAVAFAVFSPFQQKLRAMCFRPQLRDTNDTSDMTSFFFRMVDRSVTVPSVRSATP